MRLRMDLDVSPAVAIVSYLEGSAPLERLLANKGVAYMLYHHGLSSRRFARILESVVSGGEPLEGPIERALYEEYARCRRSPQPYKDFLLRVASSWSDVASEVASAAREYLPEWAEAEVRVYLMVGGDDAYGVNLVDTSAVVCNASYFLEDERRLRATLAHEVHHKALWRHMVAYRKLLNSGRSRLSAVYGVVSEVVGEGVASVLSRPYGPFRKYLAVRSEIAEHYRRFEEGVLALYRGERALEDVLGELYPNMGPIYMVGIDMTLEIVEALGLRGLRSLLEDASTYDFFRAYSEVGTRYKYSQATLDALRELRRAVQEVL